MMAPKLPTVMEPAETLEPVPTVSVPEPASPIVSAPVVVQAPPPLTVAVPLPPTFNPMTLTPVVVTLLPAPVTVSAPVPLWPIEASVRQGAATVVPGVGRRDRNGAVLPALTPTMSSPVGHGRCARGDGYLTMPTWAGVAARTPTSRDAGVHPACSAAGHSQVARPNAARGRPDGPAMSSEMPLELICAPPCASTVLLA